MNIDVYIVDAFAERGLRGNPAGVCPLQQWLDDAMMLAIAAEINQSETAFFVPEGDDFRIRWFTPTREVDHIGHATLAAGWLVIDKLEPTRGRVRFLTTGGYMLVRRVGTSAALDMPALPPRPTSVTEAAVQALGRRPREAFAAKHYLFVFDDPAEIATLHPNMIALAELDLPEAFPDHVLLEMAVERGGVSMVELGQDPIVDEIWNAGRAAMAFIAAHLDARACFDGFQQRGIVCGIVNAPEEVMRDPHFVARGFPVSVNHDDLGRTVTYPGAPIRFSRSPWRMGLQVCSTK